MADDGDEEEDEEAAAAGMVAFADDVEGSAEVCWKASGGLIGSQLLGMKMISGEAPATP